MAEFAEDLKNAVKCLREGKVILYPTDTVWGLGCDATNREAVSEIFRIKQRSDSKSLLVLVNSEFMLERYVREIPEAASMITALSDKPVTIVYPGGKNLAEGITAPDGSVGIRITSDPFCIRLIELLRKPLVSTSANISGEPTPAVFDEIPGEIVAAAAYVVWHRRGDRQKRAASPVVKIGLKGEIEIIRK
ncbi:MAG TPA: L-threonylcarbamoyladenylate synthase [Bacteroidales bacterium]|nr:L-threonylcarbamoyladenylate synthase [Bacteroidales bacterium]